MRNNETDVNLVLVTDRSECATMVRDLMRESGIEGIIRRLPLGGEAVSCGRGSGSYRRKAAPDLLLFDYSVVDDYGTDILRQLAFGSNRARVPVVLLTSPQTQDLLEAGEIDDGKAVMFSPTALKAFIAKLHIANRQRFLKALATLYQYGPILVRTPRWALPVNHRQFDHVALTA